uniref:M polyprotein n=1 Tax=Bandia virus TaxID=248060 RepID=A0A191KW78_9VIRU|nr:glycoprotein precursor [Bandia virus]
MDDEDFASHIRRRKRESGNTTEEGSGGSSTTQQASQAPPTTPTPSPESRAASTPVTESNAQTADEGNQTTTITTQASALTVPETSEPITSPTLSERSSASIEPERTESSSTGTTSRKLLSINETAPSTLTGNANALKKVGSSLMLDIRTGIDTFKLGMKFQEKRAATTQQVAGFLKSFTSLIVKSIPKSERRREIREVTEYSGTGDLSYKLIKSPGLNENDAGVDTLYSVGNLYFPSYSRLYEINIDRFDTVLQPISRYNYTHNGVLMLCQTQVGQYGMEPGLVYNRTDGTCNLQSTCKGPDLELELSELNFENIKISSTSDMPVLIIAYMTGGMGFSYENLRLHVQWGTCISLHPYNPSSCLFPIRQGIYYPVEHIVIEKKWIQSNSTLTLCGLRKTRQTTMKGVWGMETFRVKIILKRENPRKTRKLLAIEERVHKDWCVSRGMMSKYTKYMLSTAERSVPGPYLGFCNGTKFTTLPMGKEQGCYKVGKMEVHYQCSPRSSAFHAIPECNITEAEHCGHNSICIFLSLNGQGHISYSTEAGEKGVQFCNPDCMFSVRKEMYNDIIVTCPSGKQHRLTINSVDFDCPMRSWLGDKSLYICRMTHRPRLFYAILLWCLFGYMAMRIAIGLTWRGLLTCCKLISCFRNRLDRGRGYCECCKDWVNSSEEWQRHDLCLVSKCPYCAKKLSTTDLPKHAQKDCLEREKVLDGDRAIIMARRTPRVFLKFSAFLNDCTINISRLSWSMILLTMILLLIRPVYSLETVLPVQGIWEEEIKEVQYCTSSCIQEEDGCTCPSEPADETQAFTLRRPLSFHSEGTEKEIAKLVSSPKKIMKSIDVEAPWGTVHVPEAYSPPRSMKHISLSWESSRHLGNKIIVSGKSTAVMKLDPKSSISWVMTDTEASEERILTVSILDYTQVYASRLEYITGDRKVLMWSEGSCTGYCPSKCGCQRKTCQVQEWYHVRNWRCNPTWCLGVGTGCNCCAADVVELYSDWLVSVWNAEHQRTPVIACVEFDHENRVCEVVEAGVEISLGPVSISFSDPYGEEKKMAGRIALFHKKPDTVSHIDLLHNYGLTSAREICSVQSCTHGSAGDYQVFDSDVLVMDDVTSTNMFKKYRNDTAVWMAWEGVSMSYYCNPGDWSTCVGQNLVEKNSEAFQNMYELESNYSSSFFFHSTRVRGLDDTLSLDLKGRPLSSGGNINIFVTVQGLELASKKVVLEGLRLRLTDCTGCFGCTEGASCGIVLGMTAPPEFMLHLKSRSEGVIIPDTSFSVKAETDTVSKIKIFSVLNTAEVCLEILEAKYCPSCTKEAVMSCIKAQLEAPKSVVLEHRGTLFAKSNASCGASTIGCWAASLSSIGAGMKSLFTGVFGSVLKGLLMTLFPVLAIGCFVMFGDKIFLLLKLCKKGRAMAKYKDYGYKKLGDFDSVLNTENMSEKEKEFLKLVSGKNK